MKPSTKVVSAPGGKDSIADGEQKTKLSTKVHAMPGGNSNLNLGWGPGAQEEPRKTGKKLGGGPADSHNPTKPYENTVKPSTRVHAPPGGTSNIKFG